MTAVTVVCGPPGSGKTTYVREHARWGDLVVDLDAIYVAIGGQGDHRHPIGLLPFALAVRDALYRRLEYSNDVLRAWVITGGAKRSARERLRQRLGAHVIVLEAGLNECSRRIHADDSRGSKDAQVALVTKWWQDYRRDGGDECISL